MRDRVAVRTGTDDEVERTTVRERGAHDATVALIVTGLLNRFLVRSVEKPRQTVDQPPAGVASMWRPDRLDHDARGAFRGVRAGFSRNRRLIAFTLAGGAVGAAGAIARRGRR